MYCQWYIPAILCAALGIPCARPHVIPVPASVGLPVTGLATTRSTSNDSAMVLGYANSSLDGTGNTDTFDTDTQYPTRTDSSSLLDCWLKWDILKASQEHEEEEHTTSEGVTTLTVKLAMSSSDGRSMEGLQRCDLDKAAEFLLQREQGGSSYRTGMVHVDSLLFQPGVVSREDNNNNNNESFATAARKYLGPVLIRPMSFYGKDHWHRRSKNLTHKQGGYKSRQLIGTGWSCDMSLGKSGGLRSLLIWACTVVIAVIAVAAGCLCNSCDVTSKPYERPGVSMQTKQPAKSPNSSKDRCSFDISDDNNAGQSFEKFSQRRDAGLGSIRNKLTRFGHMAHVPRGRIQDLFDLEPLKFGSRGNAGERIPVLPQAPSVRGRFRDLSSQAVSGIQDDDGPVRLRAPSIRRRLRDLGYDALPGIQDGDGSQSIRSRFRSMHAANTSRKTFRKYGLPPDISVCEMNERTQQLEEQERRLHS